MGADETTGGDGEAVNSIDSRQVAFVGLAVLALVAAAFVAPVATGPGQSGAGGDGAGAGDGAGDQPGGGSGGPQVPDNGARGDSDGRRDDVFDWRDLFDWLFPEGRDVPADASPGSADIRCTITLERRPVPGGRTTVTVRHGRDPLVGAPVWFNGRRVGETDDDGRVGGRVPYERELRVRVEIREEPACQSVVSLPLGAGPNSLDSAGLSSGASGSLSAGASGSLSSGASAGRAGRVGPSNATATYEVDGDVHIDVVGKPYPGERLTVTATIAGVPVRNGTVAVDGDPVARTNDAGNATIRVPGGRTERFEVSVSRGAFGGFTSVTVLLLTVDLQPEHLLLVPGTGATVRASVADDPVAGARVAVDGTHRGTTGPDGRLFVELPADPTAQVTVSTDRQSVAVSPLDVYRPVALVLALVGSIAGAVGYRRRGLRGSVTAVGGLLAVVFAVAFVVGAEVLWGTPGRNAASALVVAVGIASVLVRWNREFSAVAAGGYGLAAGLGARLVRAIRHPDRPVRAFAHAFSGIGGWLRSKTRGALAWFLMGGLVIVRGLETAVDRLATAPGRLRRWLLAEAVPWLLAGPVSWIASLRSLPGWAVRAVRGASRRAVAALLVASIAVAGGYGVAGPRGAGMLTVVVAAAALVHRLRDYLGGERSADAGGGTQADDAVQDSQTGPGMPGRTGGGPGIERSSFRAVWREFARLVAPGSWRTRTPEEVARAAIEQGYPDGPVRELATLFAEVEYGGRTLSDLVRRRAAAAYRAAVRDREPEDPGGGGS